MMLMEAAAKLDTGVMEKLREVCEERFKIMKLNYPLKKCIACFPSLSLIIVASNCSERKIISMTNFVIGLQ